MKNLKTLLAGLALLLAAGAGLALSGCLDDGLACQEECESDDDCGGSMLCLNGSCLPKECDDCYDSGRQCDYDGPSEAGMCEYQGCL